MPRSNDQPDPLAELRAALVKIDQAIATAIALAGENITCQRGCARCCVADLSVLPVEAALIESSGSRPPAAPTPGMCAFLDEDGACSVYQARPVLCRSHGLALKTDADFARAGALRVIADNVEVCALNYRACAPTQPEILDATRLMMLLVTVDRRFRARAGLPDDASRVTLAELAARLAASPRRS